MGDKREDVTGATQLDLIAPGSRIIVRDQVWQVTELERHALETRAIVRCIGRSELVRDQPASFFSDLDRIEPEDPTKTRFRLDTSPEGIETRLVLDSLIRRTPVPVSNTDLTVGHQMSRPWPHRPRAYDMPMKPDEIAQRGWALYERDIRPQVEPAHAGRFLVVDVESGRYVLADDDLEAVERAHEQTPGGVFYLVRVGRRAAHRIGRGVCA